MNYSNMRRLLKGKRRYSGEERIGPVTVVMCEHPAWTFIDGVWLRAFSSDPDRSVAATSNSWRTFGPAAGEPDTVELTSIPATVPTSLRTSLTSLGTVTRWRTPSLWEAIATAIVRQVIRADQARVLHHRFRTAHGRPATSPHGVLHLLPDPAIVADLPAEAFASLGMLFKRRPLQAAATAYLEQGAKWAELPPRSWSRSCRPCPDRPMDRRRRRRRLHPRLDSLPPRRSRRTQVGSTRRPRHHLARQRGRLHRSVASYRR